MESRPEAHTNFCEAGLPHDSLIEYIAELEQALEDLCGSSAADSCPVCVARALLAKRS